MIGEKSYKEVRQVKTFKYLFLTNGIKIDSLLQIPDET